ncbi:hypothetical protein [Streptomyces sp. NPDC006333]|uniref:hypothetical protein n=1 Tax=Streptomyces sp. NPDC006333 TaxID=3156753 RepID=UPI0033AAB905
MTATPSLQFWITDPTPIEGAPDSLAEVVVSLVPADHPHLLVRWQYTLEDRTRITGPHGVSVHPSPETPPGEWQTIGATTVRDLPLAKLERSARQALTLGMKDPNGAPLSGYLSPLAVPEESIPTVARETVRERHPEVDPDDGAAAARRWKRLIRLAEVWLEYQAAEARGEKAPTNVIAETRGVAPATVRSWLHHAKQEGLDSSPVF